MKLIILDRDGVINKDSDKYVKNIDEFILLPNTTKAIINLRHAGFKIAICTNQSGIGRGMFSIEDLNEMHSKLHHELQNDGTYIDAIVFCPHVPEDNCKCRKPKPQMILDICDRFNVEDISQVMMVGDSLRDLEAIVAAGGIPVLVKTGNGKKTLQKNTLPANTLVFEDLLEFSEYIILNSRFNPEN